MYEKQLAKNGIEAILTEFFSFGFITLQFNSIQFNSTKDSSTPIQFNSVQFNRGFQLLHSIQLKTPREAPAGSDERGLTDWQTDRHTLCNDGSSFCALRAPCMVGFLYTYCLAQKLAYMLLSCFNSALLGVYASVSFCIFLNSWKMLVTNTLIEWRAQAVTPDN